MVLLEPRYSIRARPEQLSTAEAQDNNLKSNFMTMREVLKASWLGYNFMSMSPSHLWDFVCSLLSV